jgi:prepilin-type N-terminal cleavage/methylation domain-containing protein
MAMFTSIEFPRGRGRARLVAAFTLIEIMVVVGIMGIIITMGVPIVYRMGHKEPMTKAISEITEVLSNARKLAILKGQDVEVVFHPREGRLEVGASSGGGEGSGGGIGATHAPGNKPAPGPSIHMVGAPAAPGSGLSATLPDGVTIEDLDINLIPGGFRDAEVARVRFFPNGTCDEMRLFLVSRKGERLEIMLEVTTGLSFVEHDVLHFR